jgi:glycine cleavage system transcriptional repressor
MQRHAVLTAIGADRPGLVDEVAGWVHERGGNLEDSRMVNLRGQFAMMLLVSGDEAVIGRLRDGLSTLSRQSLLRAELTEIEAGAAAGGAAATLGPAIPYRLTTSAMDHPGLVQSVAHTLRDLGVNIESAETSLQQAPITGTPLFEMELVLSVPVATPVARLRERLGQTCDELNIDWQLTAV